MGNVIGLYTFYYYSPIASSLKSFLATLDFGVILCASSKFAVDTLFYTVLSYNLLYYLDSFLDFLVYLSVSSSFGPSYLSNLSVLTNTNITIEAAIKPKDISIKTTNIILYVNVALFVTFLSSSPVSSVVFLGIIMSAFIVVINVNLSLSHKIYKLSLSYNYPSNPFTCYISVLSEYISALALL